MPILDVEIVLRPGESLNRGLAAELADRTGQVFGSPAGTTWVKVKAIPHEGYAENGGGPPENVHPVFVSVLIWKLPSPEAMQAEVAGLTEAVSRACGCSPEHVHIQYLPEGAGRVAFGGLVAAV